MLGRERSFAASGTVEDVLRFVAEAAPFERDVSDGEWEDLTRASLLLAAYERVFRSKRRPDVFTLLPSPPADWREWAALVCSEVEVEDVAIVGWAAAQDHRNLRGQQLICNPTFELSRALGGADADLITASGALVDFKSTSTTRTCSSVDLWQLCGYALADSEDRYGITALGLFALRWRTHAVWPVSELLEALAGHRVDVGRMRRDVAKLLADLPPTRLTAARARPRRST